MCRRYKTLPLCLSVAKKEILTSSKLLGFCESSHIHIFSPLLSTASYFQFVGSTPFESLSVTDLSMISSAICQVPGLNE